MCKGIIDRTFFTLRLLKNAPNWLEKCTDTKCRLNRIRVHQQLCGAQIFMLCLLRYVTQINHTRPLCVCAQLLAVTSWLVALPWWLDAKCLCQWSWSHSQVTSSAFAWISRTKCVAKYTIRWLIAFLSAPSFRDGRSSIDTVLALINAPCKK